MESPESGALFCCGGASYLPMLVSVKIPPDKTPLRPNKRLTIGYADPALCILIGCITLRGIHASTRPPTAQSWTRGDAQLIRISADEWRKARHFGDEVWLCTVTGAKTDARDLHRVRNTAAQLRMEKDIQVTGYVVHEDVWWERVGLHTDQHGLIRIGMCGAVYW
jgi:hypothetical protein